MSVALMIIAHGDLGSSLLRQAEFNLGELNLPVGVLEVTGKDAIDDLEQAARRMLREIDDGDGVIILTDVFGATPSNVAHRCCENPAQVIHGLNLAMLLRAQCYSERKRDDLIQIMVRGGRQSVFCGSEPPLETDP